MSCTFSQSISGTFRGDAIKNFKFTKKYWYVDGFGSHKITSIYYTQNGSTSTYEFHCSEYIAWFSVENSIPILNVTKNRCEFCQKYKFTIKKIRVRWF